MWRQKKIKNEAKFVKRAKTFSRPVIHVVQVALISLGMRPSF